MAVPPATGPGVQVAGVGEGDAGAAEDAVAAAGIAQGDGARVRQALCEVGLRVEYKS